MLLLRSVIIWLFTLPFMAVAKDISGSKDDALIERPAGSWIVQYQSPQLQSYTLALGSIEKVNGVERLEKEQRLNGKLTRISYRIPEGNRIRDYVNFFNEQVKAHGAEELFSCKGRECGSSNFWANQVFDYSKLYGVDRSQYYLAAKLPGVYLAVYVIERGNRRQYAHIDLVETDTVARKLSELSQLGYVEISVDALPDTGFLNKILNALDERDDVSFVIHHEGDDLSSALKQSQTQANLLQMLLDNMESERSTPVMAVGAFAPSVLENRAMVLQLVSGADR